MNTPGKSGPFVAVSFLILVTGAMRLLGDDEAPLAGHSLHGEAFNEGPRQAAYLMDGMPKIDFPVSTTNALTQKFFNQGIGQLHGFWYFEAERSFRQAAKLDTNCVMAWWGMAMANVLNEKRAKDFIKQAVARTNAASITRREQLYIDSLSKFYGKEKRDDADASRHREYVRSLEQLIEEFPDDMEAKAFLAFKIYDNAGRLKISSHVATDALAQQVLATNPLHPVQHARIHLWNNEADRRALDAAARCGQGSPGIAHMWHMPGHTYSALHRYADAAWQQEASARVDHAYMIKNRVLPDQIHNFAHNNDWLVRNLNYLGRVHDAIDLARNMIELPRHPKYNIITRSTSTNSPGEPTDAYNASRPRDSSAAYGRTRLLETLVTWELWDDLLALENTMYLDPTDSPELEAKRIKALALAAFAKGDTNKAAKKFEELESLLKKERELRHSDVDAAEARARADKKTDDQVSKAMTDALDAHKDRIRRIERAISELRVYDAVARDDKDDVRKLLADASDIPKPRLSQIWLQLSENEKARDLAKEALKGATNEVQVLANYVDVLWRCDETEKATEQFERLRNISSLADGDLPILKRLAPLAKQLKLPDDWRAPYQPATDVGIRPSLDSLGPFRWHPSPAPDFSLTGLDGKTISLKSYHGRPVVVLFYLGYGCRHCLEQLNAFGPKTERFRDAGISILAVSTDSISALQKTFDQSTSEEGFPFPIVSDEKKEIFRKYRAYDDFEDMPLHGTFLVDGKGLVRWQDISFDPFVDVDFLLKESQRLLKLPVAPTLATSGKIKSYAAEVKGGEKLILHR
ncbi:MAG TPA: peroxiredoxin family protein [Verrucomicrobiae bacterium]|nr:peroxiredoxin family protein [Verrucomicrobiae bacterium]